MVRSKRSEFTKAFTYVRRLTEGARLKEMASAVAEAMSMIDGDSLSHSRKIFYCVKSTNRLVYFLKFKQMPCSMSKADYRTCANFMS